MPANPLRALAAIAVLAVFVAGWARWASAEGSLDRRAAPGAAAGVTAAERAAGARFAPEVSSVDRAWILAAIAQARPEAQALIAEVDGTVEFHTHRGDPLGRAASGPEGSSVTFDVAALDGRRTQDRNQAVLHELGHVIDFALVDDALAARLDAGIPRSGACGASPEGVATGACAEPAERFADTFAKWSLRGAVSLVGAGYGVPVPASLEDWGAPLGALSLQPPRP